MKVKITKCSKNGWWYKYKIGEVYEVLGTDELDPSMYWTYETLEERLNDEKSYIAKDDCVVLDGGEQMYYITKEEYNKFMAAVEEIKNKDIKNVTININVNSVDPKEQAEKVIQILTEQLTKLSLY
jgi:hypothetical protein